MEKLVINGGARLSGRIRIGGSKNAALPILFASILCHDRVELSNVPNLRDISTTLSLLEKLGCEVEKQDDFVFIVPTDSLMEEAPYELVRTMRASVLCLGPLLARTGNAKVALPGGCAIGARPVDQHLKAFERLGASFSLAEGYIIGNCEKLTGNRITFDMPTVGGTENALMAASMARGETVIENAAREPEVVDLANFLVACGAKIEGQGESTIYVEGVENLSGPRYSIMPDRIEAGTFLVAAGMTKGELELENCPVQSLDAVIAKLRQMGMEIKQLENGNTLATCSGNLECVDITTQPYPGFPTDMQAQLMALLAISSGAAIVEESIFENRFMHVQELVRMGADIRPTGRTALVRGVSSLGGAPVMASDLRASASLVLAGLAAEGTTEISRIYHLDRGYDAIEKKLKRVGADIKRIPE